MPQPLKILLICLLLPCYVSYAQGDWPSPEVEQMYHHAQQYTASGNYKDAIITYRQAMLLAPKKAELKLGLGDALYLSRDFDNAIKTLRPLIDSKDASEQTYGLLATCQASTRDMKAAHATLRKGLEKFPASGLLHHESGSLYATEHENETALSEWLAGIQKDPGYPPNYYDAARSYLRSDDVMWGLIYAEIYLDMAQDTSGEQELKKMLFTGYKTMFDHIATNDRASSRKTKRPARSNRYLSNTAQDIHLHDTYYIGPFIDAVKETFLSLTPVVSNGITTENLTMVRTRFLLSWLPRYGKFYPFLLFTYQDYLIRNGLFDIYNEWLFGKAESITEYKAWNEFHPVEMNLFLDKRKELPFRPAATDFYNEGTKQ